MSLEHSPKRTTASKTLELDSPDAEVLADTVANTARISGLAVSTVWKLISERKLETISVGRRRLVLRRSTKALLGIAD